MGEYHADVLMAANAAHIGFIFEAGGGTVYPALEEGEQRNGLLPPWKYEAGL